MKLQLPLFTATRINFTAAIETFVWTMKQVWYYSMNYTIQKYVDG